MTRLLPLLGSLMLAACVTAPEPPQPPPPQPITLDLDDPVIDAEVAGVTLRLRVDFQQKDVIELNPAAAARLALHYEEGFDVAVGRVVLQGRQARAPVVIGGIAQEMVVAVHGRDCCRGVDGAVSPVLLPYEPVRLVRAAAAGQVLRMPAVVDPDAGLTLAEPVGRDIIRVRLSLETAPAIATASAGAILARAYGGRLEGASFAVTPAFGVERQARTLRFARMPRLAGFPLTSVAVRFADFSGGRALPVEPLGPGEIEVRGRGPAPQRDWPSVSLGSDLLDRCREIAYSKAAQEILLDCRFDP